MILHLTYLTDLKLSQQLAMAGSGLDVHTFSTFTI